MPLNDESQKALLVVFVVAVLAIIPAIWKSPERKSLFHMFVTFTCLAMDCQLLGVIMELECNVMGLYISHGVFVRT